MSAVALRLESFGARPAAEPATADPGLERAYQDGYEQGLNHGREASLDALCAELARMNLNLALQEGERARIRHETLADLAPVLSGLVDLLGRASAADRLRAALQSELLQLAGSDAEAVLAIRCPADMHEDIRDCAGRAGLRNAVVEDGGPAVTTAEIRSQSGRISLDPARATAALGAIIDDIYREE